MDSVLTPVADGVWMARAPIPDGAVCLYILKGAKLAMLDTGYAHHPRESLAPALAQLGLDLADVDMILNTHGHPDHIGGNAFLKNVSGAQTHLHRGDVPLASGYQSHLNSGSDPIMAMRLLGWNDEVKRREDFLKEQIGAGVSVDCVLKDGDVIDLGGVLRLVVVHTPGHSPGSVAFVSEREGIGFTGDALQGWGVRPGILPLYFAPADYRSSLRRLAALGITKLCLGHDFYWSNDESSPIIGNRNVQRFINDSELFVDALERTMASLAPHESSPSDQIRTILGLLDPPFRVPIGSDGRFPAACAATIIGHLRRWSP